MEVETHIQKIHNSFLVLNLESDDLAESERIMKGAKLHRGEAESIVLAKKIKADMYLTDDSAARFYAGLENIEVHGSLGIVLWNFFNENISKGEAVEILNLLRKSSLWLTSATFQKAIEALES
jgi:predicted nucleic acid-binding protein